MSCTYPRRAYLRAGGGSPVFSDDYPDIVRSFVLPCGECIGCALDARRDWALRGHCEAKMHRESAFVTVTYDDARLPPGENCSYADVQSFVKRLRYYVPEPFSLMACTEYGTHTHRPHGHLDVFGFWPPDAKRWSKLHGHQLYRSARLEEIWGKGQVLVGKVSAQTAGYVGAHRLNRLDVDEEMRRRRRVDPQTGEVVLRVKEEFHASTKPAVGRLFYERYGEFVRDHDCVIDWNGRKQKPPRYFDKLTEVVDPQRYEEIKLARLLKAEQFAADGTLARREVKQLCQLDRLVKNDQSRTKL